MLFIHQNSGKLSHNKTISKELANEIVENYLSEFSDFGFTHYYEEQGYKYGISFQSIINIFIKNEIISPYAHHKTVKLYNENMKSAIRENIITENILFDYIYKN